MSVNLCWNVTDRCNENCKFCYRFISYKENSFEDNLRILEYFKEIHAEKITWTGGEALLYPHTVDLIKMSKEAGMKNNLISNGRAITPELLIELQPYLDTLTLSIDSATDNIHNEMGRGIGHGEHVFKILDFIKENNIDIEVKINTILTTKNTSGFLNLAKVLSKYKLKRWKIFKFIPLRGVAYDHCDEFDIPEKDFDVIVKKAQEYESLLNCPITMCKNQDFENYLLIDPIGNFLITKDNKDIHLGNLDTIDKEKVEKFLKNKEEVIF